MRPRAFLLASLLAIAAVPALALPMQAPLPEGPPGLLLGTPPGAPGGGNPFGGAPPVPTPSPAGGPSVLVQGPPGLLLVTPPQPGGPGTTPFSAAPPVTVPAPAAAPVPEPGTLALLGLGIGALSLRRRR